MRCYVSIEKNIEGFEYFKSLWAQLGINGFMATTMTEGIQKAIEIEKSVSDYLYFIDIVEDDIDYLPQLKILSEETSAPILIATSYYTEEKQHMAMRNGASFYGKYCSPIEYNVEAVITIINNLEEQARKQRSKPSEVLVYRKMLIAPSQRSVFINNKRVDLTKQEFDILYYLAINKGKIIPHNQIYIQIWGVENDGAERDILWTAIKRLREKLKASSDEIEYIQTMRDIGYGFLCESEM